jgi:type III secretion protein C
MEVFKLKYAWAADQSISFMGKDVVVPGVETMLKKIIFGGATLGNVAATTAKAESKMLKGKGIVGKKKASAAVSTMQSQGAASSMVKIIADQRLNAIIMWDTRKNMPYYKELISKLDQPAELVEIRAAIVDIETTRSKELGFAWSSDTTDQQRNGNKTQYLAGANRGVGTNAVDFLSTTGSGFNFSTIYTDGIDTLMAKVSMLEDDGDANVLSRPAVLTMDNVQAMLEHTQTFYVKLEGQEEVDLVDISSGTVLRVTPHIITEKDEAGRQRRKIKLVVHIEDGSDDVDADDVDNIPRVLKSTITTHAVVTEEQALVIGGHYYVSKKTNESGIPIIKNLPVIGSIFKESSVDSSKVERLFVLSPKIVDLDKLPEIGGTNMDKTLNESIGRKRLMQKYKPKKGPSKYPFRRFVDNVKKNIIVNECVDEQ